MSRVSLNAALLAGALSVVVSPVTAQPVDGTGGGAAPWSMADDYWGETEMAEARAQVQAANGANRFFMIMADRLEVQTSEESDTAVWDVNAWYGGDINKVWLKTEGEFSFEEDEMEEAEIQALWSRAVAPFWDVQAGVRHDFEPKGRTHAVVGLQGLAPYWFEVDAAAFLSTNGDLTASAEVEYEFLLTQRLVLQPRAEIGLAAQDIPELETASGFTDLEAGLRLRYEFVPEFAPYIGLEWQSALGDTRDRIETGGGEAERTVFTLGVRTWY